MRLYGLLLTRNIGLGAAMGPIEPRKFEPAALGKAAFLFLLVAGLLTAADEISLHLSLHGWERVMDDLLGGLIAGLIFYLYELRRVRRLKKQLQVIDLMNHHIRNALQPIMFVGYQERAKMQLIQESVDHIDWALREVLTGQSQETFWKGIKTGHRGHGNFFAGWFDAWKKRNNPASTL
jgi:precorrin-3B methylase